MQRLHLGLSALQLIVLILLGAACQPSIRTSTIRTHPKADVPTAKDRYAIDYVNAAEGPLLHVHAEFFRERTATIHLPDEATGDHRIYESFDHFQVTTGTVLQGDGATRTIKPERGLIAIDYDVRNATTTERTRSEPFHPIIQQTYLHVFSDRLLVTADNESEPRAIHMQWQLPATWTFAHSFGAEARDKTWVCSPAQLLKAVFVAGDFRLHSFAVHGQPVWVAMRGHFSFEDGAFVDLISRIIETERAFWRDNDFPFFLVTLIPTGEPCCSLGGTGLTQSFATYISEGAKLDKRMVHLLSHELFHTWNGRKIRRTEPEQLVYWFSEGFTNYYARLLSLRAGLTTLPQYIDDYNDVLFAYDLSPVQDADNDRIRRDFWTNRDVEKLPYQRGDILAHNWNAQLRAATHDAHGIDDVMLDLFSRAKDSDAKVSAPLIDELVRAYSPIGIRADIEGVITRGGSVTPEPLALGSCVQRERKTRAQLAYGFSRDESLAKREVSGTIPGSAAYRAGLRDGQKLKGWDVTGDPNVKARLRIATPDGNGRWIEFLPQGESREVFQYVLDRERFARDPETCLRWFNQPAYVAGEASR